MMPLQLMDINVISKLTEDINERFAEIPFGNSKFQIENFIINAQLTPARAYRAIGLNISKTLQALKAAYYGYQKNLLDIEELEDALRDIAMSSFNRRRKELELAEKKGNDGHLTKMVKDAAFEVNLYTDILRKFSKYTREQFEAEEFEHYEKELQLQVRDITGAARDLFCMNSKMQDQVKNVILKDPNYITVMEQIAQKLIELEKK